MSFRQNTPDKSVHFLRLFRRRGDPCANRPHGFISDDDTFEVIGCQPSETALKLSCDNTFRASLLSLWQHFSHTNYGLYTARERGFGLSVYRRISLEIELPSF